MGARITETEYYGPYYGHPDVTAEVSANVSGKLLPAVNALLAEADAAGFKFAENPNTGTSIYNRSEVSGEFNGGFRPQSCAIGAAKSKHKLGLAVDLYDPHARFAAWCYANRWALRKHGLTMERHEWTPTWVHLQCVPPGSMTTWVLDFIPDASPARVARLKEQDNATA